jgi:dTDP-4-dehydrorhamnose reductase
MKAVLLGPNGQLGCDIRRAQERSGAAAAELTPIGREVLDVASPARIRDVLGALDFDVLVNCTSYHKTDEVEDNAGAAFAVNAHAVEAMARACAAKRARFIHISTDYVFGGDTDVDRPLDEAAPTAPVNVYGASKAMGETLARLAHEDSVVLRVASLFGVAGASGKGGNFVETMIRVGREKGALRVVQDQIMSPTGTADIADVIVRMIADGCEPGLYHVVNTGAVSWFEFAREIIRRAGVQAVVEPCTSADYPSRALRPRYSALDNGKIAAAISPMPPWQDALDRYLREKGHVTSSGRSAAAERAG